MLATEVAIRRIDGRLEEAALIVAPPRSRAAAHHPAARCTRAWSPPPRHLRPRRLGVRRARVAARSRLHDRSLHRIRGALRLQPRDAPRRAAPRSLVCSVAAVAAMLLGDRLVTTRRLAERPAPVRRLAPTGSDGAHLLVVAVAVALPILILVREALAARSSGDAARRLRSRHREQPATCDPRARRCRGAGRMARVRAGASRSRRATGCPGRARRHVRGAEHDCRRGPDRPLEPARPARGLYGTDVMFLLGYLARFVPVAALALPRPARDTCPCRTRRPPQ